MFGNFIYFVVVLLIYTTYQPSEHTNFNLSETISLFLFLIIVFSFITWFQFKKLEKQIHKFKFHGLDQQFTNILTRQSIAAIVVFTIDIYGLNLPEFINNFPLLPNLPTLKALVFLILFIFYLGIIWACAFDIYKKIYDTSVSRNSYIFSNISFSIPVLLPWLVLSSIHDLIDILPFKMPKQLLATTEGQIIFFLFFLFIVAIIGPVLIWKFWGCKPLEYGLHRLRIETLCKHAGLEYSNILYWPIFEGRMITAGVMGLIKKFRYILVTKALLEVLRPDEIEAVIAHEIGHVKKNHILFYLFFFAGYMFLSYASFDLIIYFIIYAEPVYRFIINKGFSQSAVTSALFTLMTIFIFLIYFRYIFGYFMRNFERQADCYVYAVFESAKPLISTFEKITMTSGQSPDKPNWHHFSITERVDFLLKCEHDKRWVAKHDKKIQKSIFIYIISMIFIAMVGYCLNFGETGKKLNASFFETIIQRELKKNPDDPGLYSMIGDIYYDNKKFLNAIESYEKAISLNKDSAQVLNNLAWLYATCEDKNLRNPNRALILAIQASNLLKEAHILDTLAESYYVNGRFKEAIFAAKQALKISKTNQDYYEKQLKKFIHALKVSKSLKSCLTTLNFV